MIVELSAAGAVVHDADDCTRLHVETSLRGDKLRSALAGTDAGSVVDADTVLLDLAVLRSRAALVATAPDWPQRWSAMVEYAGRKNWLSEDGKAVQVHVERPAPG